MIRTLCVSAAIAVTVALVSPALLLGSCSGQQTEARVDQARDVKVRKPSGSVRTDPRVPLVPIAHLTSSQENVSAEELSRVRELAAPRGFLEVAGELLGRSDLESFDSADAVIGHVSRTPGALGLVPWEEVDSRVKALSINGQSLLEPGAAGSESYPLTPEEAENPNPEELRRIVVGGDIWLDRGMPYVVFELGKGRDFPLNGGYAAVTWREPRQSRYSEFGVIHKFRAERRGESGAVREYLNGADLTLANFENPGLRHATYHPEGTTFTGDLRLLPVVEQAGIDGVTLANNHVLDAGVAGLKETLGHLESAGISSAGAGMDLAAAREPMIFDLGGTKVGVLSYVDVPGYEWAWATEESPGTAPLRKDVMREDIEKLRPEVDLVVVMPHWGREYRATPEPEQVELAHAAIDAGADVVVGSHPHWAKGIEVYKGRPVFYGTGNFLADQAWSEETSTGILAEITLYEERVVQSRPVPYLVMDYVQPNFLVPEAGGERVLDTIFSVSIGPEFEAYEASSPEDPE